MLVKRKRAVSLSIGLNKLAVAEMHTAINGVISIDRFATIDTPPGAVDDNGVVDTTAVSRAIRGLLSSNNIKAKEVHLAIPGNGAIMRMKTLPLIPMDEMLEMLKGEVENYAILSGRETVINFGIMGRISEETRQRAEVLFAAVPKESIESYITVVEESNLKLLSIKTRPISIFQAFTNNQPESQIHNPVTLVEVEDNYGAISIVVDQAVKFVHDIDVKRGQLSEDDSAIKELADEIETSIHYYETTLLQNGRIQNIILFIDGIDSDAIAEALNEYLSIPVVCPHPQESLKKQILGCDLLAYSAIGAEINDDKSISLLPGKKPETLKTRKQVITALLCIFSIALISIFVNVLLKAKENSVFQQIALNGQSASVTDAQILKELAVIESNKEQLAAQVDMTASVVNSVTRVDWVKVLQELSNVTPENIWLTDFSWKDSGEIHISGSSLSPNSVFRLIDNLTNSAYFDLAKLISMQNNEANNHLLLRFEIRCKMNLEAFKSQRERTDNNPQKREVQ